MNKLPLLSLIVGVSFLAPSLVSGMDLRLQVGVMPGFDTLDLESVDIAGTGFSDSRTLVEDEGTNIGLLLGWGPSEGFGLVSGLELSLSKSGATNFEITQTGVGGRLGLGFVIIDGLRIEGGGRVMGVWSTTDDGVDSADGILYPGNVIIEERDSAAGIGYQAGLYVGANYRFLSNIMIGVEVGYVYMRSYMVTDYILNEASGAGMMATLNGGIVF